MESLVQRAFEKTFEEEKNEKYNSGADSSVPNFNIKKVEDEFGVDFHQARIVVIGAGGAGNNTVTSLYEMGINGAETIVANTDAKQLSVSKANKKILMGKETTRGLGAGGHPGLGTKAAEESSRELKEVLEGCDMLFITCGLGGGTGTGSAPVIAQIAKSRDAIVIAAVTMPFKIEGTRIVKAEEGLKELRKVCDTVIVIENQRLLKYAGNLPIKQAFMVADELVSTMIKGVTETITQPSLVNLDYADVKAIMHSGGVASIGIGEANSSDRAKEAITKAMNHPLLDMDYSGATGALIQIIGGDDLKLEEVNEIGEMVSQHLDPDAQIIWGARILPEYSGKICVISIITGVKSPYILGPQSHALEGKQPTLSDELGIPLIV